MRESSTILYLKRSLLGPVLAIVSVFSFHLAMTGETADSLFRAYINADKSSKYEIVNKLSRDLQDREITDTLYQFTKASSANAVDAVFHYLMA